MVAIKSDSYPDSCQVLKAAGLAITKPRKMVLERFLESEYGLNQSELYKYFKSRIDRVTLYRTLHTLLNKKIIHIIPSSDPDHYYAMYKRGHTECEQHLHFICNDCGRTYCIDAAPVPMVLLPSGFQSAAIEMVVKGTCKHCSG